MDPFEMAWQLLKEVGIEGPVDPRRPGMGPGMSASTGRMQGMEEDFPPEAYEQLNQALEEEARLREEGMTSEGTHTPSTPTPPPAYERSMRRAPPTPEELGGDDVSGLPPHLQRAYAQYVRPRSARGARPPQGTSVQNPDDVLRSMSPIDLAMDALQKKTPRSYRGEPGYEQFAPHAITSGADISTDNSQEEYQDMMDDISDEEAQDFENPSDLRYPSDIPVDADNFGTLNQEFDHLGSDPTGRHSSIDMARRAGLEEGVDMRQTPTPRIASLPPEGISDFDIRKPKNPFQEKYPHSSRIRSAPPPPPQGQGPRPRNPSL
jgi:hypothetical protein